MKIIFVVIVLIGLIAIEASDDAMKGMFAKWMKDYKKTYATNELQHRFGIFKENYQRIQTYNEQKMYGTATFGINQFSDLTPQEFKMTYASCHIKRTSEVTQATFEPTSGLPASVDWRTSGAVTAVKNQGQCGSCWSFGTTGTVEGAHFIKTGSLVGLSEQNLIDCSQSENNDGCEGGRADWAIQYIIQNGGIDTEASYPYKAEDGTCSYNPANRGATATGWNQTAQGDENALQIAVATIGPIAVAISVDDAFANYQSGVFVDSSCPNDADDLDHEVLVVGYGTEGGADYWIVKNSWGGSWGNQGYILMARNHNNMCGIATDAVYPTGVN